MIAIPMNSAEAKDSNWDCRALSVKPRVIICDEPVSALDVSVQAQVINLLEELQEKYDFTYIFIAHDLSVIEHISDRVAVLYLGKVVELADVGGLFDQPYTPIQRHCWPPFPL